MNHKMPPNYIPVPQHLCREGPEPLCRLVGAPIISSSGYRSNGPKGQFMDGKQDGTPFKGVRKEK